MKYICRNQDCPQCGVEEEIFEESFRYVAGQPHLVGDHCACPSCGKLREEINECADIPLSEKHVSTIFFNGMSQEQKREVLRERAHADYQKNIKEKRDHLMNQAITEMKGMGK